MTRRRIRRAAIFVALIVLAILVPPSINVTRFSQNVAPAISRSLGRQVSVGGITLQVLPQPGLRLQNFVVQDDPHFGPEPLLRAGEVVATLRLSSLWRGRLELGSLSLKEPSLNLVRSTDGHWNIEALLLRAAQTPTAPTAKPRPESRPRFPYIEAEGGRINLKLGEEKKVWALSDADFALWLASEDEWRMRLQARPMRTDASLSDAGQLRVTGSFQRHERPDQMQVSFHAALSGAQLGQLSTLVYGRDRGWRGSSEAVVDVAGTPAKLLLTASLNIDQFRRYDITPRDSMRLQLRCASQYTAAEQRLSGIECHLPAGDGDLGLRGSVASLINHPSYDLSMVARDVPMGFAVALARRAKRDLPDDLSAAGLLNAAVTVRNGENGTEWAGGGSADNVGFASAAMGSPLNLETVEFVIEPDTVGAPPLSRANARDRVSRSSHDAAPASPPVPGAWRLSIHPFTLPLGAGQPATAQGMLTRTGYTLQIAGPASLDRLLRVAHTAGVPATGQAARGAARLSMQIAGIWKGFPQPTVTGTADLHNVRLELPGVATPLQVASASINLTPAQAQVQNLALSAGGGAVTLSGSLHWARGCVGPDCHVEFALRSDRASLDDLNHLFNPRLRSQPWYRRLAGDVAPGPSLLAHVRAYGTIQVGKLALKGVTLQNLTGTLRLEPGLVELGDADAGLLGGTVHGDWRGDFTGPDPAYSGFGSMERVSLALLSTAMHDNWATGTAAGKYRLVASGWTAPQLLDSLAGSMEFSLRDCQLRHFALSAAHSPRLVGAPVPETAASALRVRSFRGRAIVRNGALTISDGAMDTAAGIYTVSGTASRSRELDLTFSMKGNQQYSVGGTLEAPRVQLRTVSEPRASVR